MTVPEAAALADWIALHQRRLTTIYITHGHGDHFLGLSVLLDRFPGARAVATAGTVQQMRKQSTSQVLDNGVRARYPGRLQTRSRWPNHLTRGKSSSRAFPWR